MDDEVQVKEIFAPYTDSHLERRLASAGEISRMREPHLKTPEQLCARKIIHPGMTDREILDRFRGLRTKLFDMNNGEGFVVMVSPVAPKSGGSFVVSNLAAAIALDNTKTALLVDCNITRPSLHRVLDVNYQFGLTDYVESPEDISIEQLICPTGIPRLRLVPAGRRQESASDYFTSVHMELFLEEVRSRYPERFVLIDAPSVTESPDAKVLAGMSDTVILCVGYAKSTRRQVAEGVVEIGTEKLAGVVFSEGN